MTQRLFLVPTTLLAIASLTAAQLPYNPTRLILSPDGSKVYQFSPQASQPSLSFLDLSTSIDSSSVPNTIAANLPFQVSANESYLPIVESNRISVLGGNCQDATTTSPQLWHFTPNTNEKNGTWTEEQLSTGTSVSANWLAAGFSFSSTVSTNDSSLYVFGGMCPNGISNSTDWTSQAAYSSSMLTLSPENTQTYDVSAAKSPAIAEAGLAITPLIPVYSNSSSGKLSKQQDFVLLGGHTSSAFINMSQVAVFSLPQAAWAFVGVNQPTTSDGELVKRDATTVEPRSGHTALLSSDGTKIYVFGGWVGDVTNPANPQLAILNVGQEYGGTGSWQWTIPAQTASPFQSGQGVYGHGAVMLPGDIMMVSGGTVLGQSNSRRSTGQNYLFYNTTSSTWTSSYQNPTSSQQNSSEDTPSGLTSAQKAGLGAGLSLGFAAVLGVAVFWCLYARRLKMKRIEREKRLRELALGSSKFHSGSLLGCGVDTRSGHSEVRSASWGSRQERQIEGRGDYSWPPVSPQEHDNAGDVDANGSAQWDDLIRANVQSPTTGLRRSLHSRGPAGFGNHFGNQMAPGPGSVFRIDEEEEGSVRSLKVRIPQLIETPNHRFEPRNEAAEERKKEVQGWVEDWQSAAEVMTLSRNPSQARTYSNLSQAHSFSNTSSDRTGGVSPIKSDRTGSNLSDKSHFSVSSIQKSANGTMSRSLSQRSASAGYSLFTSATAAMSRYVGTSSQTLDRSASKRSISLNAGQARSSRPFSAESHAPLLSRAPSKADPNGYWTPPESPIKDYKNYARTSSLTSQGHGQSRARGMLGSFKRVLTGTSQVDVQAQVEHFEVVEKEVDPNGQPEMSEVHHATTNPVEPFWQGKKGARDWHDENPTTLASTSDIRRRSGGRHQRQDFHEEEEYDGEEWDVETAIQKRVVQVMFTVPKEKLRVVNADALSLISRSDVGGDDASEVEVKRMDSVKEGDDEELNEKGKGRAKGWPLVD